MPDHTTDTTSTTHAADESIFTDDEIAFESVDPRHKKRIILMQQLFSRGFNEQNTSADSQEYDPIVQKIFKNLAAIDQKIQTAAAERPLKDVNKVDLAILRLIVFESEETKTPKKVLINEAVELAKLFGTDSSPRLVNGVLGRLLLPTQTETE